MANDQTFTDVQPLTQSFTNLVPLNSVNPPVHTGLAARRNAMAQPGITPEARAASPVNKDIVTGLENAPLVAGAITAPVATAGALVGSYALGKGAKVAAKGLGATEETQGLAEAGGELLGGLAGGVAAGKLPGGTSSLFDLPGKIMRSGIFGNGLADYFAETSSGGLVPKPAAKDLQRIHEAIGVKPSDLNIGLGATSPEDAYNLQGRPILKAGLKPQDLEGLTPFEQAEKIKTIWQKAGKAVSDTAQAATDKGITFDGAKSLTQAIGDMLDPEGSKALSMANDTAKQLGIDDWRKMTPNQAVQLKQALWDRLPGRFKGPVYGALTRDLNTAVPEMIPVNRDYSEIRAAMDTISDQQAKYLSRATPSKFDQLLTLMKQHPYITGGSGAGMLGSGMSLYRGIKDLVSGTGQ